MFFLFAEAAKYIRENGHIIFISSILSHFYVQGTSAYSALKAAGETYIRHLSRELASKRITVNSVSPGYTDTDLLPPVLRDKALIDTPFKRLGSPTDIANVVSFLASEKGSWITGQNLVTDGGVVQLQ